MEIVKKSFYIKMRYFVRAVLGMGVAGLIALYPNPTDFNQSLEDAKSYAAYGNASLNAATVLHQEAHLKGINKDMGEVRYGNARKKLREAKEAYNNAILSLGAYQISQGQEPRDYCTDDRGDTLREIILYLNIGRANAYNFQSQVFATNDEERIKDLKTALGYLNKAKSCAYSEDERLTIEDKLKIIRSGILDAVIYSETDRSENI